MINNLEFKAWIEHEDGECQMVDLPMQKLQFNFEDGYVLAFGEYGFWNTECYDHRQTEFKVLQWTGLKDHHRTKVFTGDILQSTVDPTLINWIVEHNEFGFVIRNIGTKAQIPVGNSFFDDREIIGNVFENPELIKGD